ncbi:Uncharacterised protein [uncultured archaeon]|nr:Uncharacterised protein [uncultured archaeon]
MEKKITKETTFWKWLFKSGYHNNFFIGVCSGIAAYIALEAKGLKIFSSLDALISWILLLLLFLGVYLLGGYTLYKNR